VLGLAVVLSISLAAVLSCSSGQPTGGNPPYNEDRFTLAPGAPGREKAIGARLDAGSYLEGYVEVLSGGNLDVEFWVTDPADKVIYGVTEVRGRLDFRFRVNSKGQYNLHVSNSLSPSTQKSVVVDYRMVSS